MSRTVLDRGDLPEWKEHECNASIGTRGAADKVTSNSVQAASPALMMQPLTPALSSHTMPSLSRSRGKCSVRALISLASQQVQMVMQHFRGAFHDFLEA